MRLSAGMTDKSHGVWSWGLGPAITTGDVTMSFFNNLRIGTRLACAFALLLLLLLGQVGHALRALHGAEQAGDRLVDHEWAISRALARLDAASRANALATSELLFTRSPAEADAVRSRMATNRQVVTAALNELDAALNEPSERALLARLKAQRAAFVESFTAVSQAMAAIRKNGFDKETINNCYVTDRDRTLIGVVSLRALVLSKDPDNELIRDMMDDNVVSVSTTTDQEDVSQMFEKYGYLAIPVVDNEKRLVGIVTIDDAISIMQDEASEDIAKMNAMGPSDKPYFKQSMWELYKNRAPWLLFLMISSTFSSMVIRGYEDALAAVTVLTAYIPMLTDAGGNAGSQSTSTIIRGMAVGDIEPHDLPKILWREFRVAILCGGTLALCNFAKLIFLDGITPPVAAVVCLTLICTVILSQLIGGLLPVIAEKLNFDPAVMASPLITTIVDTTTLLIYFNIARVLLKI